MSKETTTPLQQWLDELTLELRLHHVTGAAIGDALATVTEFVQDSGQEPEEAFGSARIYAQQLAAEAPKTPREGFRRQVGLSTFGLVFFLIFSAAVSPWLNAEQLLLGGTQLACFALVAVLVLTLPLYLNVLLRHMWALVALPVLGGAAGVLGAVLQPREAIGALFALSPLPVLLVTATLMLAVAVLGTLSDGKAAPDTISNPLQPAPAKATLKSRCLEILPHWFLPFFALLMFGLIAVMDALS